MDLFRDYDYGARGPFLHTWIWVSKAWGNPRVPRTRALLDDHRCFHLEVAS